VPTFHLLPRKVFCQRESAPEDKRSFTLKENGLYYKDKENEKEYSRLGSFHQIHRISESVETKE
jgi:hypothetical protein